MRIIVSDKALQWFKEEMEVVPGDTIRFFVRYGGSSPFHTGFSLGMNREHPLEIGVKTILHDISFYIEEKDLWFFNDHNLVVDVDHKLDELKYNYELERHVSLQDRAI